MERTCIVCGSHNVRRGKICMRCNRKASRWRDYCVADIHTGPRLLPVSQLTSGRRRCNKCSAAMQARYDDAGEPRYTNGLVAHDAKAHDEGFYHRRRLTVALLMGKALL